MKKYLTDLYKRKDLILYLVTSGLKAQHRNSFLGYFWWLLDPLLGVFIYYFVVVVVFRRGGGGLWHFSCRWYDRLEMAELHHHCSVQVDNCSSRRYHAGLPTEGPFPHLRCHHSTSQFWLWSFSDCHIFNFFPARSGHRVTLAALYNDHAATFHFSDSFFDSLCMCIRERYRQPCQSSFALMVFWVAGDLEGGYDPRRRTLAFEYKSHEPLLSQLSKCLYL